MALADFVWCTKMPLVYVSIILKQY